MLNKAGRKMGIGHSPQFFETNAVLLRPAGGVQPIAGDRLFRQRSARPLGEKHVPAEKLHAPCETRLRATLVVDAHVAGRNAYDFPFLPIQQLRRRESRIDLNAQGLGAGAEPARNRPQRADKIAVVAHQFGHRPIGQPHAARLSQIIELINRNPKS